MNDITNVEDNSSALDDKTGTSYVEAEVNINAVTFEDKVDDVVYNNNYIVSNEQTENKFINMIKKVISKLSSFSLKTKITAASIVGLLIVGIVFYNFTNFGQMFQVKINGLLKREDKLINTVSNNYRLSSKRNLVELAIDEIVENHDEKGISYLDHLFSDDSNEPSDIKIHTVEAFSNNNITFINIKTPLLYLVNHYDTESSSRNVLISHIKKYSSSEIDSALIKILGDLYEKNDYIRFNQTIDLYKEQQLGNNGTFESLMDLLNSKTKISEDLKVESKQIDLVSSEIEPFQKKIDDANSSIKDINSKKGELQGTISNAQSKLAVQSNYKSQTFYVIAQNDDGTYEISMPEYDYYYGRLPSSAHAVLVLHGTNFTTKGWATLDVYDRGKVDVKVKEDFGGFTQQWTKYEEVSKEDKDNIAKLQAQIQDANNKMTDGDKQISELNRQIDEINKTNLKDLNNKRLEEYSKYSDIKGAIDKLDKQIKEKLGLT